MTVDPEIVFETERLRVRKAEIKDADLLLCLWTDPRIMSHMGFPRGLRITREEIVESLAKQNASEFGRWLVVEEKAAGRAIGECHMRLPNEEGIAETDVKLLPAFWGNRFGIEVKRGLIAHIFSRTEAGAVEATPNVGNVASIRMQEAVGGVRVGEATFDFPESMRAWTTSVHHYVYRVYRKDWEQRTAG